MKTQAQPLHYFDFIHISFVGLLADFILRFLQNVGDGTNGFVRDSDVKTFQDFCNFCRSPFGVQKNNQTSLVSMFSTCFSLCIRVATITK